MPSIPRSCLDPQAAQTALAASANARFHPHLTYVDHLDCRDCSTTHDHSTSCIVRDQPSETLGDESLTSPSYTRCCGSRSSVRCITSRVASTAAVF